MINTISEIASDHKLERFIVFQHTFSLVIFQVLLFLGIHQDIKSRKAGARKRTVTY